MIYQFACPRCGGREEVSRPVAQRNDKLCCPHCRKSLMRRLISIPTMQVWNPERRFPNLSTEGDGTKTFESKSAYDTYLKTNGFVELAHDGKIARPHGSRIAYSDKQEDPAPRGGFWD